MRNLNRIRSEGSERMEARELLSGSQMADNPFGVGNNPVGNNTMLAGGGKKGGFGGSKKGGGMFFNGASSSGGGSYGGAYGSSSSSGYGSSSSSYEQSSYESSMYGSSSYSGSYGYGGGNGGGGGYGYSRGYSTGYNKGFTNGFNYGYAYGSSGGNNGGGNDGSTDPNCEPPTPPVDECPPTPAPPTPTPPAPSPPDYSRGHFNGQEYYLKKQSGTKWTYKNESLQGGQRTVDYNTITGTYKTHSPIAFDLNGTGKIETTGASTAKGHAFATGANTVSFDIDGTGAKTIEWMAKDAKGNVDGLLVDNRDGQAATNMDGNHLFGTAGGFDNGYDKLATLDKNGDGKLTGVETKGLQVWVDKNADAKVDGGELKSLGDYKINQISVRQTTNTAGLMRSTAGQGSNQVMSEDIWFAEAPTSA